MSEIVLKDVGLIKNRLMNTCLNSQDICEGLLMDKPYTEDSVENLLYTQIFPYLYIDDTQTEVLPYLCIEVDVPSIPTHTIKDLRVNVLIYSHKKCMKYSRKGYLGTRVDILSDMVERQFRELDNLGIGKLQLNSVTHVFPNNSYYGRQMLFTIPTFKLKA